MYVNLNMYWSVIVFAFWDLVALIPMQWRPPNHCLFFFPMQFFGTRGAKCFKPRSGG